MDWSLQVIMVINQTDLSMPLVSTVAYLVAMHTVLSTPK